MLQKAKDGIDKATKHLDIEYWKLQLGRANPALLEDIVVEVYGTPGPLKNSASVSVMDPQTLNIKPWDKSVIHTIEKAISDSGMWLNPQNMWESIIIKVPTLTEERRREISKIAKKLAEEAKIWIRNARAESHKDIKKALDEKEISEDEEKNLQTELQKIVDEANKKIDEHYKNKDADIMKV
jgi:ribosome recycling factor